MFVDRVSVTFKAGDGGDGITSFRREKFRQMGGPDGGDGGDGGDIILIASRNQNTLANFRYKKLIKAESGKSGSRAKKHGKSGVDLEVMVPVGTVVMDTQNMQLADLTNDEQKTVIAKGGKGGFGNAHFVSSTRQAPRVAENGEPGQEQSVTLELKMIADVGLVGLPNAGKSTLLSVISNAKPEVADYPFTTIHPNLGVVDIDGKTSLLFADIPGLIEGASKGKGLGDEFLRHIERTSVLVHLIDIYNPDIAGAYHTIINELAEYKPDLSKRPQVIVLTKTEGVAKKDTDKALKTLKNLVPKGTPILAISSSSGFGLKDLLRQVERLSKKKQASSAKRKLPSIPVIGLKADDTNWQIKRSDDNFVVTGKRIEQFARRTRFADYYGEQRMRDILHKNGVLRELERQGIVPEQDIIIGDPEIGRLEY
jgi:GTP-binding protein